MADEREAITKARPITFDPFSGGPLETAVPTTSSQREIWATLILDSESSLCYNESLSISIKGPLDLNALEFALNEITKSHDALRSIFSSDGLFFFTKAFAPQNLNLFDFSQSVEASKELRILEERQVLEKFDLLKGPCFKHTLVKVAQDTHYLIITAHHLVCDGWSFAVLLSELSSFYSQVRMSKGLSQNSSPQFAEFSATSENLVDEKDKAYWINEFKRKLSVKKIPLDKPRPSYRTYNSERIDFSISEATVQSLRKIGAGHGSSLYTVLMSSFHVLLNKLTGSSELVVGMAAAGQSDADKKDLVGHLVNLLPLRSEIDSQKTFSQHLKLTSVKMLDAYDHQKYSFGELLKELDFERNPSEIPLVNIVFNIDQQSTNQGMNFEGLTASYKTIPRKFENFEIFVNAVILGNKLSFECQYNTNLFHSSTISNWFENYNHFLNVLDQNLTKTLSSIELPTLYIPKLQQGVQLQQTPKFERNLVAESQLLAVWKKVLKLEEIQVDDNFFSLGGHSLLIVEMLTLIKKEFSTEISARLVYENPTVSSLASKLASVPTAVSQISTPVPSNLSSAPVTHNQMQVWYLEQVYPGTLMHNLPSSIRLPFELNKEVMEKVLTELVLRHPILRTIITVENGLPIQKVLSPEFSQFKIELDVVETNESEIQRLLNQEAKFCFDLTKAPLFKAKIFKLAPKDYVFFFMPHHSIWDGWSFDIFFEEIDELYRSVALGKKPIFKNNPTVSYIDYSLWLKKAVETGELNHQLDYWKTKLKSPLPVVEIPSDFKRPTTATHVGATLPFLLSSDLASSLRAYAKKQQTSVFNVLLTAFKLTLSKFANQEDIIVGSPVRARNHNELKHTLGYFVNALALRTKISPKFSFEENLKAVSQTCLEAFDNQQLPFQVVLNSVPHPRDKSRTPIFQTFFSYQDVANREAVLNGHPYTQINIDKESIHTDLDLWIKTSVHKIEGAFEYRKDLFKVESIKKFSESFLSCLSSLSSEKPEPFISAPQNYTSIHAMFEANVKSKPQAIAVVNEVGSISYADLNRQANKVAHYLLSAGVVRGDFVGICLTRDPDMLAGLLGILKAGVGYLPLDPSFPQKRLDYMLNHSKPKVLITDSKNQSRFNLDSKLDIETILNDSKISEENPNILLPIESPAYVIYTSGSTGDPKGVQVSHRALSNFLVSMAKNPGMTANDRILAVTTLSFDIAGLELFLPLVTGASLYLANTYDVIDGNSLKNIIESKNISIMQATPSTWRLLLASGWRGNDQFKVLCGGEPFPRDLAEKLLKICGEVWNMYGPTETTIWSTCENLQLNQSTISIGKPIDNTFTYILDEGLNVVPAGEIGELYIGGLGLADGYYKQPLLTSEKFISNPFRSTELMYATGDLARLTNQGTIECLGRQDGQVKVRGYRIELGEIENALSKFEFIKENAAITKEVQPGDVRIIGFLILSPDARFDEKDLRKDLGEKLPRYMIPSHFVVLDKLPQTLNGKIDKKSLASLFTDVTAPIPEIKTVSKNDPEMKGLWREVLKLDTITGKDNFFDLGGNSLVAVQLFSKIHQLYGINLPLSILLETNDLDSFSEAVSLRLPGATANKKIYSYLVPIKPDGSKNPIFSFHGVGGNVLNYVSLVPALTPDRPLVGVQSSGLILGKPFETIEEMAKAYIEEIKQYQPVGPYFLCGGSMGGTIAFEVAQQLKKSGDKIEKLVMFDTFGPRSQMVTYSRDDRSLFEKIKSAIVYRKNFFIHSFQMKLVKFMGLTVPLKNHLFEIELNNYRALSYYAPRDYEGDLILIRAKMKSTGWYSDPYMGWGNVIKGKMTTFEIDASHNDFIETPELQKVLSIIV